MKGDFDHLDQYLIFWQFHSRDSIEIFMLFGIEMPHCDAMLQSFLVKSVTIPNKEIFVG